MKGSVPMFRRFILLFALFLVFTGWHTVANAAESRDIKADEITGVRKTPKTTTSLPKTQVTTQKLKAPKPDLIITDMSITPAIPKKGQKVIFTAKVLNRGLAAAPWHQAAIRVGGETHPPPVTVHALAPNASREIKRQTVINRPGNFVVAFIADASKGVAESNETNNTKYLNFKVVELLPDLTLVDPVFTPANPKAGDAVTVTATSKNIGDVAAGFHHFGIRIGGQSQPDIIGSAGHLDVWTPQSQKYGVSRMWYTSKPGTYIVRLYIDVNNEVKEKRENNNMVSLTINVAP